MNSPHAVALLIPVAALVLAVAHITFEHFNGGVKTHHFLARGDFPGFSNWFGLAVLPLVAIVLAVRVRSMPRTTGLIGIPYSIVVPLTGSLLYGAMFAASFHLGASQVSWVALVGLFLCALAFPVYRAEYIFGFVVGMTLTFGSVIPLLLSLVLAALSFVGRCAAHLIASLFHSK